MLNFKIKNSSFMIIGILSYILKIMANSNCDTDILNSFGRSGYIYSPIVAAKANNTAMIRCLHSKGVNLNVQEPRTLKTAIIISAENGFSELTNILSVEIRVKYLTQDLSGKNALMYAVINDHKDDVFSLIDNLGAKQQCSNGDTAFILAARLNRSGDMLDKMLYYAFFYEPSFDLNIVNKFGETALIVASRYGYEEFVNKLLKYNPLLNIQNKAYKQTALIVAARGGYINIVQALIQKGADLNIRSKLGKLFDNN
jgi:ankyrin repeat protein